MVPKPIRTWQESEFFEVVRDNIHEMEFKQPTPIQMQAIPIGLALQDMIGLAPTGSGKTVAFLLPIIDLLLKLPPPKREDGPYALILAPVRELAI